MPTYYVRTDGDDSTGDGSTEAPWKTLTKALGTVSWTGDKTILLGDGVYVEGTGGSEYLLIQHQPAAGTMVIQPENGAAGDVTIKGGTSTTYQIRIDNTWNLLLQWLKFTSNVDLGDLSAVVKFTGADHDIEIRNCQIIVPSVAGITLFGLFGEMAGSQDTNHVTIAECVFTQTGANDVVLLRFGRTGASSIVDSLTISNCTFTALYQSLYLYGITNLVLADNTASNTSGIAPNVTLGENADAGLGCSGEVNGGTYISLASHGFLVGAICSNIDLSNVVITGGDQGLVLKHCDTVTVSECLITNGSVSALYCKGATNITISNSTIRNNAGVVVRVGASGDDTKSGNIDFQHNKVYATGTALLLAWSDDTGDSGGCVCDYNKYSLADISAPFGVVRADADVNTLTELRAAWAGYGTGLNDSHSYVGSSNVTEILVLIRR